MKPIALYCMIMIGWLMIAPIPVSGNPAGEINSDMGKKVVCQDCEEFCINEWHTVETVNLPVADGDFILVEKRYLRLTLYRDGKVVKRYTVAIGKPSTPTPVGEWKIVHKGGKWGGGFGARWLGISCPWGIYGIHGTNKPESIGRMSSHGCVRMQNRDVTELYNLVQVGTPVHIIGELGPVELRKNYQRGATGEDVLKLQFAMRQMGFDPGPADARFGVGMEQAVYKMQLFYGLAATGKIALNEQFLLGLH